MENIIYKIARQNEWQQSKSQGQFNGSADDQRDGFIHFSSAQQLKGTLAKHFAKRSGLLLIAVEAQSLGDALKWEPSRGGDLFPHLYRSLKSDEVLWEAQIHTDPAGDHILPELDP